MGFNGDLYPTAGASSVMTTKGDLVRYDSARERYGIGSSGQVLQVASGLPAWTTINLADSVLTTQGDVLYEGASALARLGQSTNNYTLATKGSGANPAWQASSTSTLSGTGDVLYSSGANTLARLAIGSANDVLTVAGGVPTWSAPAGGGGSFEFVEQFTLASDSATFTGALATPFDSEDYDIRVTLAGKRKTAVGTIDFNFVSGAVGASGNWYWSNKLSGGTLSSAQDGNKASFFLTQADQMGATVNFASILDFTRNPILSPYQGHLYGQYSITIPNQDYYQGGLYCEGTFGDIDDMVLSTDGGEFVAGTQMQIWRIAKS